MSISFYLDGAVRQRTNGVEKQGTYEQLPGDRIRLKTASTDTTLSFKVTKTKLNLGESYEFSRTPAPLLGTWKRGNESFEFREDGTWRKEVGSTVTTGTYMVLQASVFGSDHEILYARDDIILGAVDKRVNFRVEGDTLKIRLPGNSTAYEYQRK
jgi:hypothetical protein